ncbi:penicillin-binding protein [Enterococcus florum]|uniref:Penicillin-binding protein n=1 Tax=Enterococcus florum TaxID=2480627 RepID=A0A4P5PKC9_9ENTE|nr:serine hydrolase domain-containing protein [Enterococcus florum]GCF93793.1 penicillin-binding protein [Enterococcus florum]
MKKRRMVAAALLTILLVPLVTGPTAQATKEKEKSGAYEAAYRKFDQAMKKKMKEEGIPSASMAVRGNGKTIRTKTFGKSNTEKDLPMTKKTMFSTGSVSKVYAAAAALKLADDGKLDLDAPVTQYIPEFRMVDERYEDITVRMLLNHTSGMPGDASGIDCDWAGKVDNDDFLENTLNELSTQPLKSKPGASANYCNSGFVLAQQVIEIAAGQSFGEYLSETFLKPMKMKNTAMSSDTSISKDRVARPIDSKGNRLPKEYIGASADALGGMTASPEEMAKFAEQILSPDAGYLSQEGIDTFRSDQSLGTAMPKQQLNNSFGFDRISPEYIDTQVYEKAGGTTNYSSKVLTAPDAGLSIAGSITQLNLSFTALLDELMHDLLVAKGTVKKNTTMPDLPKEKTGKPSETSTDYYYSNDTMFANAGIKKTEIKNNQLSLTSYQGTEWVAEDNYAQREDGSFGKLDTKTNQYTGYSFKTVNGVTYLMKTTMTPNYSNTTAVARKIEVDESKEFSDAWKQRDNSLWLRKNVNPVDYQAFACISSIQLIPELKGYALTNGAQPLMEIGDDQTLKDISETPGAHYPDAKVTDETLDFMGMNFISAEEAKPLTKGKNTADFQEKNTAEWFVVPKKMTIDAKAKYQKVRVIAYDLETGLVYDNIGKSEAFEVPAGSYVMMTSSRAQRFDFNVK